MSCLKNNMKIDFGCWLSNYLIFKYALWGNHNLPCSNLSTCIIPASFTLVISIPLTFKLFFSPFQHSAFPPECPSGFLLIPHPLKLTLSPLPSIHLFAFLLIFSTTINPQRELTMEGWSHTEATSVSVQICSVNLSMF